MEGIELEMNDLNGPIQNLFVPNTRFHKSTRRYVISDIDPTSMFEIGEESYFDEYGYPQTVETSNIHKADCGHMVGFYGGHELIAQCSKCEKYLCHRCGNLRCRRCLIVLCERCASVVDQDAVYCQSCRVVVSAKNGIFSVLKGLHVLLSRRIS